MIQQDPNSHKGVDNQTGDHARELSEREKALFLTLAEMVPGLVFVRRAARFCFVNQAMETTSGYSAHELLGMDFRDLVHPEFQDLIQEQWLARAPGDLTPSRYETKILKKDGEARWLEVANSVIDLEGHTAVLGVGFDITERKQTELALRNFEARHRSLLENSPVCIKIIDTESRLQYMSNAGVTRLKIPDITPFYGSEYPPAFYSESMRTPLVVHLQRAIAGDVTSVECPVLDMEGGEVWYHTTFVPARNDDGDIAHVIATSVDITERKQAEQKLQELHERLETQIAQRTKDLKKQQIAALNLAEDAEIARSKLACMNQVLEDRNVELKESAATLAREQYLFNTLFETLPDPVWFKDVQGRFIRVNQATAREAGFQHPDELIGKTDADIWLGCLAEKTQEDERRIMQTGIPLIDEEEQLIVLGGEMQWVLLTKMALHNEANEVVGTFGLGRIITERKRSEEKQLRLNELLNNANESLKQSNMELQQFAYIASHDLQAPLRSIAAFAQFLQKDYQGRLDDQADDYINRMVGSVKNMQTMIGDLLAYSRVESQSVSFHPVDLNQVCDDLVEMLRTMLEDTDGEVSHEELPTVAGEHSQLVQLMQNLIGNSIKYHGDQPPRVHVSAEWKDDAWTIAVRDEGIGIDAKNHDKIFEIFCRLHTEQEYSGTGIGLAICRRIVHRHGGQMWLESQPGEGSTFYFSIPASPQEEI